MSRQWLTEADEYVCTLLPEDQEVAKNELREDALIRAQALRNFREWIQKNPRIENCRLDSNFLLRFLRFKKYSVPQAQEALERFILLKQTFPENFRNLDMLQPRIMELLNRGVVFSSPNRDKLGRRVIIVRVGQLDPNKYNNNDICRLGGIVHESLIEDERSQVNGFIYLTDAAGFTLQYLTLFTPKEAVRLVKNGERTVPTRHKEGHGINLPPGFKYAIDFGLSIVSEKLRSRIQIHNSPEDIVKKIDKKLLPLEYGGETPMAEMIESFKAELLAKRDVVMNNDKLSVRLEFYNEAAKEGSVSALKNGIFCKDESDRYGNKDLCGNFRKLEVD